MLEQLLPRRRGLPGEDPIFLANAEATRRRAAGESIVNATVGALLDDAGRLVVHDSVMALWKELGPLDVAPYAPIAGEPSFLTALVQRHWPELEHFGAGCASPGGSGALMISLRNFLEPGMSVLTAAPFWGPYRTLAGESQVKVATAPFPLPGQSLDAEAWHREGAQLIETQGRLLVWLNDPCHNPTGHSFTRADRESLMATLRDLAQRGPVTLLLDCAYLDYTADPVHVREALDHYAAFAQEGPVLVGAALSVSKSLTLYGARAGALVFPWTPDRDLQAALTVSCRGTFSTSNRAPQILVTRLARDGKAQEKLAAEHRHWCDVLFSRAQAFDQALQAQGLPGAPWTGGFFVTVRTPDAKGLDQRLRQSGVYGVPLEGGLRVGLCGLKTSEAPRFAEALREAMAPGT